MTVPPGETLFRIQAVRALSTRPFGRPIAATPRPWRWLTCLVVVFALLVLAFLCTAEYSRKETVRGWLVARDGVARITHNSTGIVDGIAINTGDVVRAGDPVIYVSRERFLRDGRSSGDAALKELAAQIAAVNRRAELLQAEAAIQKTSLDTELRSLDEQRAALVLQIKEQHGRIEGAADRLARLSVAARRGAVSDWEVSRWRDEEVMLRQSSRGMERDLIGLDRERERLTARVGSLPAETERLLSNLASERSRLQQQITEQESAQHVVLKSPVTGRLASIEVQEGGAIRANQLLATVLPLNMTMVAEVYVPSSAVGFIRRGQSVRLSYDAFPRQKFGTFAGNVASVSEFVLMPAEVPQTFYPREATFKVQIELQSDAIAFTAGSAPLRPGMLLAAEIVLEKRSLADWLLEPIRLRGSDDA